MYTSCGVFNHINSKLYHYAGNNPVKYTDPDGREVISHNDKNGFSKFISELGDCFEISASLGFVAGISLNMGPIVSADVEIDLGSRNETINKYGTKNTDSLGCVIDLSIFDFVGAGLYGKKEAPTDNNKGVYANLSERGDLKTDAWIGIKNLTSNNEDLKLSVGIKALIGLEISVDIMEVLDLFPDSMPEE